MKIRQIWIVVMVLFISAMSAQAAPSMIKNYFLKAFGAKPVDNQLVIGGTLAATSASSVDLAGATTVASGGGLTVQSGGTFTIDPGATVVSTAAVFMNITGAEGLTVTYGVDAGSFTSTAEVTVGTDLVVGDDATITDDLNIGAATRVIDAGTSNIRISTHVAVTGDLSTTENVDVNGSLLLDVTFITRNGAAATQTLTETQSGFINVTSTGAVTLNLPAVSGNAGLSYSIIIDSTAAIAPFAVTLDGDGSETINGETTNAEMDNWFDTITVWCDGLEWFIKSKILN